MRFFTLLVLIVCLTSTAEAGIFCGGSLIPGRARRIDRRSDRQAARSSCGANSAAACAACQVP